MNKFKHLLPIYALTAALFSAPTSTWAGSNSSCPVGHNFQLDLAALIAPIQSQEELKNHLADLQKNSSPLNLLSPSAREQFVNSVTFNDKGVTSYRYDVLELELTLSQAYRVLALLGAQHHIVHLKNARVETEMGKEIRSRLQKDDHTKCVDYPRYKCVAPATCASAPGYICMHSC